MLGLRPAIDRSPVLDLSSGNNSRLPRLRPLPAAFVLGATNSSQSSTHRHRKRLVEAQSVQLAPTQTPQLVHNEASRGTALNGARHHSRRLKVAVDVDEGGPQGSFAEGEGQLC